MFPFLLKTFEYITPLSTLTSLSGKLTDAKMGGFTQWLIKKFVKTYKIQLDECLEPDLTKYETFNDFFVRPLKPEARPIDRKCIAVSPVDGTVGQAGDIVAGRLIQAKGIDYSLRGLLGGGDQDLQCFDKGRFCCTYLSPANYHRIHMPLDGTLVRTIHIPGKHFPVGRRNVSHMPDLFTKNERLVCIFNTPSGPFALVMVAAAMVGSIVTTWDGRVVRRSGIEVKNFTPDQYQFKRGDELGMFKFGSTVICVWPQELGQLNELMIPAQTVKMGQAMIGEGDLHVNVVIDPESAAKSEDANQQTEVKSIGVDTEQLSSDSQPVVEVTTGSSAAATTDSPAAPASSEVNATSKAPVAADSPESRADTESSTPSAEDKVELSKEQAAADKSQDNKGQ